MTVSLKKLITIILAGALAVTFISCRSIDPTLTTKTASFDQSVTPMRVVINTDSIKSCFPGGWRDDYERRMEMRKWGDGYRRDMPGVKGYSYKCCSFSDQESAVRIIRNNLMFDRDSRNAWMAPGTITAGILYFMGMPAASDTLTIDLEAAVMKPDGRVLKVYRAKGIDTEYLAFYWGYANPDIPAYMNALIAGCADLRKQIEADRENLNKIIK
ncbi:MAG: hypothetical protein MUD12_17140 [Spirochaetes bacterium]|nr:hypothetical protein [Spirochaetota bacterium]